MPNRTKEIKLKNIKYAELNPNSTYVFQIDTTNETKESVGRICKKVKELLNNYNINNVIIYPYSKDYKPITIVELKEN